MDHDTVGAPALSVLIGVIPTKVATQDTALRALPSQQ